MINSSFSKKVAGKWKSSWMAACMVSLALATAAPSAHATGRGSDQVIADRSPIVPLPRARVLADNVVVSPAAPAPANSAPAQPNQTVVVPQAAAPAPQAAPAVDTKSTQKNVQAEVAAPRNYMSTIAISALMGGLTGGLVGGAIYYLGSDQEARNIAYWAAGGVLVGAGVGITQVIVQENRVSNAVSRLPSDPAPTYRLALLRINY